MKSVVRIIKPNFSTIEEFQSSDLYNHINTVQGPKDVSIEVVRGTNGKIAVIASSNNTSIDGELETDVRTAIRDAGIRGPQVDNKLTFNTTEELQTWKDSWVAP
jgi:hypothetical protein